MRGSVGTSPLHADPQSYYDEKPPRMTRIRQTGPVWMSKSEADADGASENDLDDPAFSYY